jgi:hypothetical protein
MSGAGQRYEFAHCVRMDSKPVQRASLDVLIATLQYRAFRGEFIFETKVVQL